MLFALTAQFAAVLALMVLVLAFVTVIKRANARQPWGDGGDESLHRAIRAHAHLVEYAPIFLVLFALLEARGTDPQVLMTLGTVFIASRVIYGVYSFVRQSLALRVIGFWTTAAPIAVAAGWLLVVGAPA